MSASSCTTAQVPASPAPSPAVSRPAGSLDAAPKAQVAAEAVAPKSSAVDHILLTPRLDAILESYSKEGQGDAELLKLILQAKAREDERLATVDALRTEQLRAANTLAMYTYYAQMSQVAAFQQQQQQQQAAAALPSCVNRMAPPTSKPLPPYQPLSPPCEPTHVGTLSPGKRSRQSSESVSDAAASVISSSATSEVPAGKKHKTSPPSSVASSSSAGRSASPPALTLGPGRTSHADVMAALRRKCEANQQQAAAKSAAARSAASPRAIAPRPPTVTSRASSVASNASTPAPAAPAARTRRKSSPQQVPIGRHTGFLRTAAAPAAAASEDTVAPVSPISPADGAAAAASTSTAAVVEPPVTSTRNKLALLLHASESSAAQMSPSWHPTATAATSDVRGSPQAA
ncbi:hypothetical protein JCM3774_002909 [Rhodotorula dairenensis]